MFSFSSACYIIYCGNYKNLHTIWIQNKIFEPWLGCSVPFLLTLKELWTLLWRKLVHIFLSTPQLLRFTEKLHRMQSAEHFQGSFQCYKTCWGCLKAHLVLFAECSKWITYFEIPVQSGLKDKPTHPNINVSGEKKAVLVSGKSLSLVLMTPALFAQVCPSQQLCAVLFAVQVFGPLLPAALGQCRYAPNLG